MPATQRAMDPTATAFIRVVNNKRSWGSIMSRLSLHGASLGRNMETIEVSPFINEAFLKNHIYGQLTYFVNAP